jgi:hypothetical protein
MPRVFLKEKATRDTYVVLLRCVDAAETRRKRSPYFAPKRNESTPIALRCDSTCQSMSAARLQQNKHQKGCEAARLGTGSRRLPVSSFRLHTTRAGGWQRIWRNTATAMTGSAATTPSESRSQLQPQVRPNSPPPPVQFLPSRAEFSCLVLCSIAGLNYSVLLTD